MKYFVNLDGKQFPVQLTNPPIDFSKLDAFEKVNGSAIIGTPDLFMGLKKDGSRYKAFSLRLSSPVIKIDVKKSIDINKKKLEEPIVEEIIEEQIVIEDDVPYGFTWSAEAEKEPVEIVTVDTLEIIKANSDHTRTMNFTSILKGDKYITYQKEKNVWIKQFGSEQLNLAHDMHMKCDKGYVVERVSKEFPAFTINEDFGSDEIDTPEISILVFLKKEAFTPCQKKTIHTFDSRIVVANDESDDNSDNPFIVIKNYLGQCDLSIRISDLIEDASVFGRLL